MNNQKTVVVEVIVNWDGNKDSGKAVNPENAVDALVMFHTVLQKLESLRYQPHWNHLRDKSRITGCTNFVDSVDVLLFGDLQAGENILLVTDSQDIKAVADHCNFDASPYGFLLVKVADDKSWETYAEVYASECLVPAANCQVNKIV